MRVPWHTLSRGFFPPTLLGIELKSVWYHVPLPAEPSGWPVLFFVFEIGFDAT